MKRALLVAIALAWGCASSDDEALDGAGSGGGEGEGEGEGTSMLPDGDGGGEGEGEGEGEGQSGTLTAGDWDDNLNYELYERYVESMFQRYGDELPQIQPQHRPHPIPDTAPANLDLAFVIDTTGSMGDELEYIKVEVQDIVDRVSERHSGLNVRLGLVVYRDDGDAYVVRDFDFQSLEDFQSDLGAQRAAGGGDYPEAMDRALQAAVGLQWRTADAANVLFLIADAPPHDGRYDDVIAGAEAARSSGIVIHPVVASGSGDKMEFLLRAAAQATAGRYVFLTDHSGLGLPHTAPTIPCYVVQKLNALMSRLIDREILGVYEPPDAEEIVDTVGTVENGICFPPELDEQLLEDALYGADDSFVLW